MNNYYPTSTTFAAPTTTTYADMDASDVLMSLAHNGGYRGLLCVLYILDESEDTAGTLDETMTNVVVGDSNINGAPFTTKYVPQVVNNTLEAPIKLGYVYKVNGVIVASNLPATTASDTYHSSSLSRSYALPESKAKPVIQYYAIAADGSYAQVAFKQFNREVPEFTAIMKKYGNSMVGMVLPTKAIAAWLNK